MLDVTFQTDWRPGTNTRQAPAANWVFLLPDLAVKHVVCLGPPRTSTLDALIRQGAKVSIVCTDRASFRRTERYVQQHGPGTIVPVRAEPGGPLPIEEASADLIYVPGRFAARSLIGHRAGVVALKRALKDGGSVYFELFGTVRWTRRTEALRQVAEAFPCAQPYWLAPLGGELRTAVPAHDRTTLRFVTRKHLPAPSLALARLERAVLDRVRASARAVWLTGKAVRSPVHPGETLRTTALAGHARGPHGGGHPARNGLRRFRGLFHRTVDRLGRLLMEHLPWERIGWRYAVLASCASDAPVMSPPRYLRSIAAAAGISIDRHRWFLSAGGEFLSRKVLVFLFGGESEEPDYVVKITRVPAMNYRLENEYRALSLLSQRGAVDVRTLPRAAFFGYSNGLAVLGETAIRGREFEHCSRLTSDCPHAHAVVRWICELGGASADTGSARPDQVAARLQPLLHRLAEVYSLGSTHQDFLREQIATIARSRAPFPLVFQHGDPGTWNIMVTDAGGIAVLDWEAAEAQGMPLWDLFYFLHNYGALGASKLRAQDLGKLFGGCLPVECPLTELGFDAVGRYCDRVPLARELVEPLFYACWVHRALKEATRLSPHQLETGHYIRFLRRCIDHHGTAPMQRLFRWTPSVPARDGSTVAAGCDR